MWRGSPRAPTTRTAALSCVPRQIRRLTSNRVIMEAPPAPTKPVPPGFSLIREGKAAVLMKENEETNRDLSIVMIKLYQEMVKAEHDHKAELAKAKGKSLDPPEGLRVLEALSATGLRSIRYWKEIPGLKNILANDIDPAAVEAIRRNVAFNDVSTDSVTPNQGDACLVMYQHKDHASQFDVVDLDPYGTASPFLDGAVQAVKDGGLLAVTCTDLAVLCGNHSEVCYSKYGAMPLKGKHCHETALRIVLSSIESAANRYKRHIVPLLSLSIDFYVRLFVRVFTSAAEVKRTPSKLALVYQCIGCETHHLQPVGKSIEQGDSKKYVPGLGPPVGQFCEQCGKRHALGGPIWTRPIYDAVVVKNVLSHLETNAELYGAQKRVHAMVSALSEELPDVPLFLSLPSAAATLHLTTPPASLVRKAIRNQGFRVSISHTEPTALKTDAPLDLIWDALRAWNKLHPAKNLSPDSPAHSILEKPPKVVFDLTKLADEPEGAKEGPRVAKFLPNPEEYWGPKARAKGKKKRGKDDGAEDQQQGEQKKAARTKGNEEKVEGQSEPREQRKTRGAKK